VSGVREVITKDDDLIYCKSLVAIKLLLEPTPPQIFELMPGQYVDQSGKAI
jgi:hypothetical protein